MILFRKRRLRRARSEREAAQLRLRAAFDRGDTRAAHYAWKALQGATHQVMKLEVK